MTKLLIFVILFDYNDKLNDPIVGVLLEMGCVIKKKKFNIEVSIANLLIKVRRFLSSIPNMWALHIIEMSVTLECAILAMCIQDQP